MKYRFAASAMTGSRGELVDHSLPVLAGAVPGGLAGSWYVVFAVGDVDQPLPRAHSTGDYGHYRGARVPFLNGDGCIVRVAFDGGGASATKRLVATPCLAVDAYTHAHGAALRFANSGLTRSSTRLGSRNFANTALQLVRFGAGDEAITHLLANYDAGPPVLLDPLTLSVRRVLGDNDDWVGQIKKSFAFRLVSCTAHPAWDAHEQRLYLLEYGRTLLAFAASLSRLVRKEIPHLEAFDPNAPIPESGLLLPVDHGPRDDDAFAEALLVNSKSERESLERIELWLGRHAERAAADPGAYGEIQQASGGVAGLNDLLTSIWRRIRPAVEQRKALLPDAEDNVRRPPFLDLMTWEGDALRHHPVVTPDGKPIRIRNSSHQLGVTRHHVIVADTAFKFELDLGVPHPEEKTFISELIRTRLSSAQPVTARLYVISKADLAATPEGQPVTARAFKAHAELVHFLTDYDDHDGTRVYLHVVDNRAADAAEFLLAGDRSPFDGDKEISRRILGAMPCGLDTNAIETFALDLTQAPESKDNPFVYARPVGRCERAPPLFHDPTAAVATWTLGLGSAYSVGGVEPNPERHSDSYWYSQGLIPEMVNQINIELYTFDDTDQRRRTTPIERVRELAWAGGIAPALFHLRHDRTTNEYAVVQTYPVPKPTMLFTSPHFVAHPDTPGSTTRGWLLCGVFRDDRSFEGEPSPLGVAEKLKELWIFDAEQLAAGPVCRLDATALEWSYTLHSAWLAQADHPTRAATLADSGPRPGFTAADFAHVTDDEMRRLLGQALGW